MERIVHKAKTFKEADAWDRRQQLSMPPQERIRVARILQQRVFGPPKAIRTCLKNT